MVDGRTGLGQLRHEDDELHWFFTGAGADVGFHAQAYGAAGGGGVFDAAAQAHDSRLDTRHRAAVHRERRVRCVLGALSLVHYATVEAAYTPRQWDAALAREMACRRPAGTLAGLAITTVAARQAYVAWGAGRKKPPPDLHAPAPSSLVEFLTYEARKASSRVLVPVRAETIARLVDALVAYRAARIILTAGAA